MGAVLTRTRSRRYSPRKSQIIQEKATMDPRYPIGKFEMPKEITAARRQHAIEEIASAPAKLRAAVKGLNEAQLDTPYRAGGWTVRQVVHHVPDRHVNAYMRFELGLTEEKPTIQPYQGGPSRELAGSQ